MRWQFGFSTAVAPGQGDKNMVHRARKTVAWLVLCLFASVTALDSALHLPLYGSYLCPEMVATIEALGLRRGGPPSVVPPGGQIDAEDECPVCKLAGLGKLPPPPPERLADVPPACVVLDYSGSLSFLGGTFLRGPRGPPAAIASAPLA